MAKKKKIPAKKFAKKAKKTIASKKSVEAPAPARKHSPSKPPRSTKVKNEIKSDNAAKPAAKPSSKASAREDLRSKVLARAKVSKPIAFTLDEAREIAKTLPVKSDGLSSDDKTGSKTNGSGRKSDIALSKSAQPNHVKAASLADILGFNPAKKKNNPIVDADDSMPEKYRRFYKLLIDLRDHLTGQLDQHTEETLKRSAKDDAGDLSSYGQHMADAGTDTFDRDFALSLVSNEQEALSEIDAAIKRIKIGTYGICEVTGKPIAKERLSAVPFTRYSAEAQKDIEKNRYRSRQQAGLFGELGEEGAKIADEEASGGEE
ncbi:MAG: TraR/DksA C4-type zinc finger protein [Opitutaceae bacterium]